MSNQKDAANEISGATYWWPLIVIFPVLGAGVVKATPLAAYIPVDLTVTALAIVYSAAMLRLLSHGWHVRGLLPLLAFTLIIILDQFRVPNGSYGEIKFGIFLGSAMGASVAIAILVGSGRRLESFNLSWPLLAGMTILLALPSLGTLGDTTAGGFLESAGRLYIGDATSGNSGGIGYIAATGLIYVVIASSAGKMRVFYAIPLGALFTLFAFGSASRGAALGLIAAALVGAALISKHLRLILRLLFAVALTLLILLLIIPDSVKSRLNFNDPTRLELWGAARDGFLSQPIIGNGLGSFADTYTPYGYPHNLFLEVGYELGIVGLVVLAIILVIAWRNIYAFRDQYPVVILGCITAFFLAGSMVSSDITNRYLWIPLTLCLTVPSIYGGHRSQSRRRGLAPRTNSNSRQVSMDRRVIPSTP